MDGRQGAGGFPLYIPSGRTPFFGFVFGTAAGAAAAVVLSIIYAYGIIYVPIVQIEFILTAVFGAAIGATTGGVMSAFKVRSTPVIVLVSFCIGVFGWLFSWLPWIYGVFNRADVALGVLDVLNPLFLLEAIPEIYRTGTWSIGSSSTEAVSGLPLALVWLIEAGMIIGLATLVGAGMGLGRVFCERCETWCTLLDGQAVYDAGACDTIGEALTVRADLGPLSSTPGPSEPNHWASLKLGFCPQCGETNVVALDTITETINPKGQRERAVKPHTPYVCISRDQMAQLRQSIAQRAQPGVSP